MMIIKRKLYADLDPQSEAELEEMYKEFIVKDKPNANKKLKKPIGLGLGVGAVTGLGIGALSKNKKLGLGIGALTGGTLGGLGGFAYQKRKQCKDYQTNKEDLKNVLKGYGKNYEERSKFLKVLRDDLSNI